MSHKEFVVNLSVYYGEQNETKVDITYKWVRANISEGLLAGLFDKILVTEKFFPTVSELAKYVGRSGADQAGIAFRSAVNVARRYGSYESIEFEDTKIAQTIREGWGTWRNFCLDDEKEVWIQKRFVELYNSLIGGYDGHLCGIIESSGSQHHKVNQVKSAVGALEAHPRQQIGGK